MISWWQWTKCRFISLHIHGKSHLCISVNVASDELLIYSQKTIPVVRKTKAVYKSKTRRVRDEGD